MELPEEAQPTLPRSARIGLDVGKARIGVAASDPDGLLAMPVETVRRGPGDLKRIGEIIAERNASFCYIGLPKHLKGGEGESAQDARGFAKRLANLLAKSGANIGVNYIDERLTTVTATSQLSQAGRKTNRHRAVIDQQAAVIILQSALDTERISGARAGLPYQSSDRGTR